MEQGSEEYGKKFLKYVGYEVACFVIMQSLSGGVLCKKSGRNEVDYSVTKPSEYTVIVNGIGNYTGEQEVVYQAAGKFFAAC